jgi:hypothetical protein
VNGSAAGTARLPARACTRQHTWQRRLHDTWHAAGVAHGTGHVAGSGITRGADRHVGARRRVNTMNEHEM